MNDIATKTTTSYILDKYNLHAKKKFGQNFLIDTNIVEKIANAGNIDKDTCVIEIGPGIGALTQVLARHAGYVICYEIDEELKAVHKEFLTENNIEIRYLDFLKADLEKVTNEIGKTYKKICIVANLPYYITTKIIERVVYTNTKINTVVVMVQKEVAQKLTSDYKSPLTFMIEYRGISSYQFTVTKNVFIPAPRVDSAVMKIELNNPYNNKLHDVLETCFVQRRKTIYNNLKKKYENSKYILENSDIEENKRSEELTINDFISITKNI